MSTGAGPPAEVYFVSGDIYKNFTGGTLCDRMVVEELQRTRQVHFVIPQLGALLGFDRPLLAGFINNVRNLFRTFPRGSLLFLEHGVYRDCFIAANVWKLLYRCRVVGLIYHLDSELPEIHGGRALRRTIERWAISACDFVLTISRSTADHLQLLGQPANRIARIPVSRRFGPQPLRTKPITEGTVRFLFVGSIEPRKGLLDAIHALGAYQGTERIVFDCVGQLDREGRHFRELLWAAEGYSSLVVNFAGSVTQEALVRHLLAADAFLFPSRWEGYGIAIEEAMCFALPVIAYDAGSVPELVDHGLTGWLAPVGDVTALGHAVAECIQNGEERQRRGAAGLAKARQTTAEQNLAAILDNAIARVLRAD